MHISSLPPLTSHLWLSDKTLSAFAFDQFEKKNPFYQRFFQSRRGKYIGADMSHKFSKHIMCAQCKVSL